jgi:hypothetical protein
MGRGAQPKGSVRRGQGGGRRPAARDGAGCGAAHGDAGRERAQRRTGQRREGAGGGDDGAGLVGQRLVAGGGQRAGRRGVGTGSWRAGGGGETRPGVAGLLVAPGSGSPQGKEEGTVRPKPRPLSPAHTARRRAGCATPCGAAGRRRGAGRAHPRPPAGCARRAPCLGAGAGCGVGAGCLGVVEGEAGRGGGGARRGAARRAARRRSRLARRGYGRARRRRLRRRRARSRPRERPAGLTKRCAGSRASPGRADAGRGARNTPSVTSAGTSILWGAVGFGGVWRVFASCFVVVAIESGVRGGPRARKGGRAGWDRTSRG